MTDRTYNGWTNYATWRVNLELFDVFEPENWGFDLSDRYTLKNELYLYAEDAIYHSGSEGIARDLAMAFLSDVDWYQIADHMIEAYMPAQQEDE